MICNEKKTMTTWFMDDPNEFWVCITCRLIFVHYDSAWNFVAKFWFLSHSASAGLESSRKALPLGTRQCKASSSSSSLLLLMSSVGLGAMNGVYCSDVVPMMINLHLWRVRGWGVMKRSAARWIDDTESANSSCGNGQWGWGCCCCRCQLGFYAERAAMLGFIFWGNL